MKSLADQLKQIPDDRERSLAVRVTIAALNDQLVYESSLSFWHRLKHGSSVTALGRAIFLLRESFPESNDHMPTIMNMEYQAEDDTKYG